MFNTNECGIPWVIVEGLKQVDGDIDMNERERERDEQSDIGWFSFVGFYGSSTPVGYLSPVPTYIY